MPAYDVLIDTPEPLAFSISAHSEAGAEYLARESLRADYAGATGAVVPDLRVDLLRRVGGATMLHTTLAEVLASAVD